MLALIPTTCARGHALLLVDDPEGDVVDAPGFAVRAAAAANMTVVVAARDLSFTCPLCGGIEDASAHVAFSLLRRIAPALALTHVSDN